MSVCPGVIWCAICGALGSTSTTPEGRIALTWRVPTDVLVGPPPVDRGALLRRAVGVVSDVARLQAEAAAVLDAYAKE